MWVAQHCLLLFSTTRDFLLCSCIDYVTEEIIHGSLMPATYWLRRASSTCHCNEKSS